MTENRVALITGGGSGIGRACAEALATSGVRVAVVDVSEGGQAVAEAVGGRFFQADLTERAACRRVVEETAAHFGRLDILVNNAGFQHIDPIPDFPEETWDAMLALMLRAPFLLTKYAWPYLTAAEHGRIVNIASAHALTASPFKAAYVSAKHGLLGLTKVTALEGGPYGLTCNALCSAYVRTPLVDNQIQDQARTRGISPEEVEQKVLLENVAIKKLLEPEDVAASVVFLCSEAAWGVTGSAQMLDLGWTAR
ncbi:3-hydroxybutyrate dehydrogenase [Truepera radiovictrix]|uniref:Short-chain dehydrogenase/reductase SDR n=1 Tax=Truepera radiovictrix (strain DSM 17093 / CIP 108686 / LMG 22925 / RQ-24) TaxID=649638 RepID=D7CQY0_TRURR|nr:3-hydroxybutyrate dehydrogenase [Truepera radiovictrix]ADI15114.1 short-chain dehydrogenase/reductase SDR [Truepera radiovictrix DSM 17093]WMT56333.1 3-hydroxybutyrate dehydrogenase [Truepera radiovictrix]